jgi:putative hydrolase
MGTSTNHQIATRLREAADLLEQQAANPFRVGAYRRAAETVAGLDEALQTLFERGGVDALVALPHIGNGIATAIEEMLRTGRWGQLERLRGALDPEHLFRAVPGIGPALARRMHETLHIDTLEALEAAAHDGRLETVPGVGARRAAAIRATLESMLRRVPRRYRDQGPAHPGIGIILEVDAEYRARAASDDLPTIAPRRFNPEGRSWLPILHTERDGWHFTALFSNTARAHELGRTSDWVVVYHYDDHHQEGQATVVTETRGALLGKRVVRGHEAECRAFYAEKG